MRKHSLEERLNIEYPIIQAGMAGGVTTAELVAAVSNSGGLGSLGAGYMTPQDMKASIHKIKELTDKPFTVNVFVPEYPDVTEEELERADKLVTSYYRELGITERTNLNVDRELFEKQIEVIIEEEVPVCSFTFGIPSETVIHTLKTEGIILVGTATTVEEAICNEEAGMDMVVAQGSEAGGHRGAFLKERGNQLIGTMSLIPQVADHVQLPVIAAGGIMDGRGVRASFALGAQGAQLGTAFVTCEESGAKNQHKAAIMKAKESDAVLTSAFSGKLARGIQNKFIRDMSGKEQDFLPYPMQNSLTKALRKTAAKQNKPEYMSLWSGQSPRLSQSISAEELIDSIVREMKSEN